jgi:hypothetical protein
MFTHHQQWKVWQPMQSDSINITCKVQDHQGSGVLGVMGVTEWEFMLKLSKISAKEWFVFRDIRDDITMKKQYALTGEQLLVRYCN